MRLWKSLSNQCAASSRSAAFEEFHLIHSFCIIVCDEIAQSTAQTSLEFLFEMGKSLLIFCLFSEKPASGRLPPTLTRPKAGETDYDNTVINISTVSTRDSKEEKARERENFKFCWNYWKK